MVYTRLQHPRYDLLGRSKLVHDLQLGIAHPVRKLYHMDLYIFGLHKICPKDNLDSKHIRVYNQAVGYHSSQLGKHKPKLHLVRHNLYWGHTALNHSLLGCLVEVR